jgi:hypothetical protein
VDIGVAATGSVSGGWEENAPQQAATVLYQNLMSSQTSITPARHVRDSLSWMSQQLEIIFGELGIVQYLNAFIDQGFDSWETILDITESDL